MMMRVFLSSTSFSGNQEDEGESDKRTFITQSKWVSYNTRQETTSQEGGMGAQESSRMKRQNNVKEP